jgi:hypothetical protein
MGGIRSRKARRRHIEEDKPAAGTPRFLEHRPAKWNLLRRSAFCVKGLPRGRPSGSADERMKPEASPENLPLLAAASPGGCACGVEYIPLSPRRRIEPTSPTSDPRDGST